MSLFTFNNFKCYFNKSLQYVPSNCGETCDVRLTHRITLVGAALRSASLCAEDRRYASYLYLTDTEFMTLN